MNGAEHKYILGVTSGKPQYWSGWAENLKIRTYMYKIYTSVLG